MLKTERLTLRPLTSEDASWVASGIADPQVHRWLTAPPHPYGLDDAQAFIDRTADDPFFCAIVYAQGPCGVVSVKRGHDGAGNPAQDLGYWLARTASGQGVMTEAASALVGAHFAVSDKVLESGWIEGNTASRRVLAKLGFTRTGETRMIHARFHGCAMPVQRVRLTRPAWLALETAPEAR